MIDVVDKEFYHVHSPVDIQDRPNKNADKWQVGNSISFGLNESDTNALHDRVFNPELNVNDYSARIRWIANRRNRADANTNMSEYNQEFFLGSLLFQSLQIARETVHEEVRKSKYPHKLSRLTGIWLSDLSELNMWSKTFRNNDNAKAYLVKFTGQIHQADARWIRMKSLSFEYFYNNAIGYWNGDVYPQKRNPEIEYIGNGTVKIIQEVTI